ncbi:MAG: PilW family protein, partial [Gammaproteobacteria bacterium]|nr:PilW family protein [Gammaproteobacteria bacterium]
GFSLVELMIAITISLLLLAGVIQIFLASRQTYTMQDGMSRLQENARYALDRISQDIARSGYMGCSDSAAVAIANNLLDQTGRFDFTTPIAGEDNTGVDGTDVLTLRFGSSGGIHLTDKYDTDTKYSLQIDSTNPNYNNIRQYDLMTFGDCGHIMVVMITNDPGTSAGAIQFNPGIAADSGPNQGQENISGDWNGLEPIGTEKGSYATAFSISSTTYLVGASTSGTGNSLYVDSIAPANELIQGVEDFQVQFGVNNDTDLGADRYVAADDVGAANWNNVVSMRLTLRLNTVDPVQAGATIAKDFTTTVRLRNRGDTIL